MAAAVLIFMLALSITLSSFSTFRNQLEDLILADERIDTATITKTDDEENTKTSYINYISGSDERRTVGIETIANSLYRVYKENYMVVIKLNITDYDKFKNKPLEKYNNLIVKGSDLVKYQKYSKDSSDVIKSSDTLLVFDIPSAKNDKEYINKALDAGLYNLLKEKTFIEYTGIYYETDTDEIGFDWDKDSETTKQSKERAETVSDVNKKEARVITYIEKTI